MKKKNLTIYTTRGALIAAIYVALTAIASAVGLSSGAIQFRISEALCILPIFMPEAVPGLFIGCLISNVLSGCVVWDVIFGSLATLIGASLYYLLIVVVFPGHPVFEVVSRIACIALVFVIRILATKLKWDLPKAIIFSEMQEHMDEKTPETLLK